MTQSDHHLKIRGRRSYSRHSDRLRLEIQCGFQLEDRSVSGGRIGSILTSYDHTPEGYRNVYIRTFEIDREKVDQLKNDFGETTVMLYMIDHRRNRREIYRS